MIKAIPTTYRGTQFRSRLEATWARNLDGWGIVWQYEPEGYTLPTGARYLPDFWLPEISTWLEIKGPRGERLEKVRQFSDALFDDATVDGYIQGTWPMVVVGEVPIGPAASFYGANPDTEIFALAGCPVCGGKSFYSWTGIWECRKCFKGDRRSFTFWYSAHPSARAHTAGELLPFRTFQWKPTRPSRGANDPLFDIPRSARS